MDVFGVDSYSFTHSQIPSHTSHVLRILEHFNDAIALNLALNLMSAMLEKLRGPE